MAPLPLALLPPFGVGLRLADLRPGGLTRGAVNHGKGLGKMANFHGKMSQNAGKMIIPSGGSGKMGDDQVIKAMV